MTPPGDPVEEGLTLEQYTDLTVALFGKDGPERDAAAEALGIRADRVDAIVAAWTRRVQSDLSLLQRFNDLYQQALVRAGVQRPDVPMETYAEIMGATSSGTPLDQALAQHGMDMQQFALLSQYWGQQMMADPGLAQRYLAAILAAQKPQG
jgi:hypothetical protein